MATDKAKIIAGLRFCAILLTILGIAYGCYWVGWSEKPKPTDIIAAMAMWALWLSCQNEAANGR